MTFSGVESGNTTVEYKGVSVIFIKLLISQYYEHKLNSSD